MVEEAVAGSLRTLNEYVLGSVLVLVCIAFYFTVKALRQDVKDAQAQAAAAIKEKEDELRQERREWKEDVRGMTRLANSVDEFREKMFYDGPDRRRG